jgi:hypothetical protein
VFKSQYSQKKKNTFGSKDITQWENVCPACARSWVQFPSIVKSKKENGEENKWRQCPLLHLRVEGLKKTKVKPLNYSQVTVVQQGPEENPLTFLQHLKDPIRKHTTVDPESQVGEVLLKDKFLAVSLRYL